MKAIKKNWDNALQSSIKRRVLLINPRFQLLFLGFSGFNAFLILAVLFYANSYFFNKFHQLALDLRLAPDHLVFQFLNYQKHTMSTLYLFLVISVSVILGTFGLVFSHRIAGPLYRLKMHLGENGKEGKLTKVHFRKNDFFQEIADAYNQLAKGKSSVGKRGKAA